MSIRAVTHSQRPDLAESSLWIEEVAWPEYNRHSETLSRYWHRLTPELPDFQFVLFDEERQKVLARANTVPLHWDGDMDHLPPTMDALAKHAFGLLERRGRPNALSAIAAEIPPEYRSRGLGTQILLAMRSIAEAYGLSHLVAPVRPNWKERYPLTPIGQYMWWKRGDGLPFDPWIRVHYRLGARFLKPAPRSLRITGSVAEWEAWTGMKFPATGRYVFPRGLAPLRIDLEADRGRYWEPNVWMRHAVG